MLIIDNGTGRPKTWADLKTHQKLRAEVSLSGRLHAAKKWINSCCRKHPKCGAKVSKPLPRRVLDLRLFKESRKISLLETHGETGLYACLTYRWGPESLCKTTKANISSMMANIPWDTLPQTFKDAVLVASKFKIHYLWIDALCIIQGNDSLQDWEEQSAAMADIYGNAFLTIAAANCTNPQEGFLFKRRNFETPLVLRAEAPDGLDSSALVVYARRRYDHSRFTWNPMLGNSDQNALSTRGWCFQEYLLAPRLLQFGPEEMMFVCNRSCRCECRFRPSSVDYLPFKLYYQRLLYPYTKGPFSANEYWSSVVTEYSGRDLTVSSDRLPALSGVAKKFQALCGCEYLAGLWNSHDLIASLAWQSSESEAVRTSEYRAPSWSWASVEGDIQPSPLFGNGFVLPQNEVLEVNCQPLTCDPTGSVRGGYIRAKGVFLSVTLPKADGCFLWRNGSSRFFGRDYTCDPATVPACLDMLCWYLGYSEVSSDCSRNHQMIVLQQVRDQPSVFERIGYATICVHPDSGPDRMFFVQGYEDCIKEITIR